jgi:acyl-CoA reductase-like NAD-dependent aldehyde dehydrogenase
MSNDEQIISEIVSRARIAQAKVANYTQEQIDDVCRSVAWQTYCDENIKVCAETAVSETGMGNVADKITKHKVKVLGSLLESLKGKTVGLVEENKETGIRKYAKPVGVIGALAPVTNPTATPASNAIAILKGRNAMILAPHPKAKRSAKVVCDFMRAGLKAVGAPEDLIQFIAEPTLELSQELMRQVDLVLATGGPGVVKAAYSSGKPAYGVGAGNAVAIVAEDADIEDAAKKIHLSKVFDNATSCSSENSIIVKESVCGKMLKALAALGAHICTEQEKEALEKVTNPDGITWRVRKVFADAGFKDVDKKKAGKGVSSNEATKELVKFRGEIHAARKTGLRRASVRDFHSFRVTWVTLALTAGVPIELVQKVTGHKTVDVVLKHYFQPGREEFRRALQTAMPKLLTNGAKTLKEKMLGILDRTTGKTWEKDAVKLRALIAEL